VPLKGWHARAMFIVHKKGLVKDGHNPTLLTGYGGFNVSLTPPSAAAPICGWNMVVFTWLPNLRGGAEFGEDWHRAGMLEKKQNVFDDFIAAAEYLIAEKYTDDDHLAIQGGSNGGLLMGAMITQRPELFRAVVCAVPLLDMLRYQKFPDREALDSGVRFVRGSEAVRVALRLFALPSR